MRDTTRVARHAVLVPDAPFGFADGTRITVRIDHLDGTIGQGLGRFRLAADDRGGTAGRRGRARAAPAAARDPGRGSAQVGRGGSDGVLPLEHSVAQVGARGRSRPREGSWSISQIPSTLVMGETASFERPSYELRERGSFTARGERVYAGTPKALQPMRDDQPANRLGLARWLVDENNPLVARVAVNRLWEQLFGRGIVETSEDFGTQGAPPSHPGAARLAGDRADDERMEPEGDHPLDRDVGHVPAVVAASRRQLIERDPYNRLLARGPRFRLDAEMIRDVVLAASGLLSAEDRRPERIPARSPTGIWNMPYSSDKWTTSEGEDRYRREPLHVLAADVAVSELHDVRRDQPRVLHRPARAHRTRRCRR